MPPKTRTKSGGIEPDVVFPAIPKFLPSSQLPTLKSVIGVLRHLTSGGKSNVKHDDAVKEVTKQVYAKWFHDTVYCISFRGIEKKVTKLWKTFKEGKKRLNENNGVGKAVEEYKVIAAQADHLFDIGTSSKEQEEKCKEDWGVKMSAVEKAYYLERKMECDKGVDPVWFCSMMRRERMREREEQYRLERDQQFLFKDLNSITEMLSKEGVIMSASDMSVDVTPSKVGE